MFVSLSTLFGGEVCISARATPVGLWSVRFGGPLAEFGLSAGEPRYSCTLRRTLVIALKVNETLAARQSQVLNYNLTKFEHAEDTRLVILSSGSSKEDGSKLMRPGESMKLIIGRPGAISVSAEGFVSNTSAPPSHRHTSQQPQTRMNRSLKLEGVSKQHVLQRMPDNLARCHLRHVHGNASGFIPDGTITMHDKELGHNEHGHEQVGVHGLDSTLMR